MSPIPCRFDPFPAQTPSLQTMTVKDPQYYIEGVLNRNRLILARTITLIESNLPSHQEIARTIIDELLPLTGRAYRLGITGVPGAGKSTFIESFGTMLTGLGHRVAVLAIDPSSTRSGGSILGDKTRMERLAVNDSAFIRPSPSQGTLGVVARKRSEERRVGKECRRLCRSRWSPYH
jgi:LAO/AO transport system kinase